MFLSCFPSPRPPPSHILREDCNHQMYVSGATEVEVRSTEEAFEVLYRGKRESHSCDTYICIARLHFYTRCDKKLGSHVESGNEASDTCTSFSPLPLSPDPDLFSNVGWEQSYKHLYQSS